MTTTERPRTAVEAPAVDRPATRGSGSAQRAYARRRRREQRIADPRLSRVGVPIRSALSKVPVVFTAILLLAAGVAGVLTINTVTDEMRLQISRTESANVERRLQVEALQQQVADGDSTPRIAQQARRMGMIPAGDPAIITIDRSGGHAVIGTPAPQTAPVAPPPATTAATTAPKTTAPNATAPKTTAPNATAPKTTAPKATTTPANSAATSAARTSRSGAGR